MTSLMRQNNENFGVKLAIAVKFRAKKEARFPPIWRFWVSPGQLFMVLL